MRRRILTLLFVAITAITVLAPVGASAGNGASVLVEKSHNAAAYYHVTDGCLEAWFLILAGQETGMSNDETPDRSDTSFLLSALGYDTCQENVVFFVETEETDLNDLKIDIAGGLNQATISGTTTAYDWLNDVEIPISMDLSWLAFGSKYHDHESRQVELPGPDGGTLTLHLHEQALWRHATSGGTIAFGEHVFQVEADAELLTATLFSANAGEVILER